MMPQPLHPMPLGLSARDRRSGSLLLMVLVILVILSIMAVTVIQRRTTDEMTVAASLSHAQARRAAESGLHTAMAWAMSDRADTSADGGPFYTDMGHRGLTDPALFEEISVGGSGPDGQPLGRATLVYVDGDPNTAVGLTLFGFTDEASRLNINTASREQWLSILADVGVANDQAQAMVDAIQQWRGVRLDTAVDTQAASSQTRGGQTSRGNTNPVATANPLGAGGATNPVATAASAATTADGAAATPQTATDQTSSAGEDSSSTDTAYPTESAAVAYRTKGGNFETVEELLRVTLPDGQPAFPPSLLFGNDRNRNGVLEAAESGASFADGPPSGLYPLLTVWSQDSSAALADGQRLLNINAELAAPDQTAASATGLANQALGDMGATAPTPAEQGYLDGLLAAGVNQTIAEAMLAFRKGGGTFYSVGDVALAGATAGLSDSEIAAILEKLVTLDTTMGAININTASESVLKAWLVRVKRYSADPNLAAETAAQLLNARSGLNPSEARSIAWVRGIIADEDLRVLARYATTRSFQFRVDVTGASEDGRAFHRLEAVFDISRSRPVVLYRRDISRLGPAIRPTDFTGQ